MRTSASLLVGWLALSVACTPAPRSDAGTSLDDAGLPDAAASSDAGSDAGALVDASQPDAALAPDGGTHDDGGLLAEPELRGLWITRFAFSDNALSAWPTSLAPVPEAEGDVQHALYLHPEWLAVDESGQNNDAEYLWFTPANPAVRDHTVAVVREILEGYDVDGIHLDRIRTPGPGYSHDAVAEARFAEAQSQEPTLTFADFMRAEVNALVSAIYDVVLEVRPEAKLSAAVWGIHTPLPGCSTSRGFADYYQDSWAWIEGGYIDALVPMIYWPIEDGACTDFVALLDTFLAQQGGRQVWAGVHALEIRGGYTWDFAALRGRLEHTRAAGAFGTVLFASTYLDQDATRWQAFIGDEEAPGPYFLPAPVPPLAHR